MSQWVRDELDVEDSPLLSGSGDKESWTLPSEKSPSAFRKVFDWISISRIFPSTYSLDAHPSTDPGLFIRWRLLQTYGFDGYDPLTGVMTDADGKSDHVVDENFPLGWMLVSFLGFPSRPASIGDTRFTVLQFFRNLIGGWNQVKETIKGNALNDRQEREFTGEYDKETNHPILKEASFTQRRWTEKKIFLSVFFIFKIAIIATFKLITFPFKLMLNVVKLATEFLLPLVSYSIAAINVFMVTITQALAKIVVGYRPYRSNNKPKYKLSFGVLWIIFLIPVAALTLAVGIVQYATLLACRIGLALTSPAKSARYAFDAGYRFPVGGKVVGAIMGGIGAVLSLALSAVLWTITFPLALGALTTVFPAILTAITWVAQLPFVAWASQLPIVTGSATLLNSLFGTVGTALTAAFGPAVTALAGVISVQVTPIVMAVGTTLGLIVTPVAAVLSEVADKLSNLWTQWVEQRPLHSLFSRSAKVTPAPDAALPSSRPPSGPIVAAAHLLGVEKEIIVPKQVCIYQETSGDYLVSSKARAIKAHVKEAEENAQTAAKLLPGIQVEGELGKELYLRAVKNVDKSFTQRATLAEGEAGVYQIMRAPPVIN